MDLNTDSCGVENTIQQDVQKKVDDLCNNRKRCKDSSEEDYRLTQKRSVKITYHCTSK